MIGYSGKGACHCSQCDEPKDPEVKCIGCNHEGHLSEFIGDDDGGSDDKCPICGNKNWEFL
jgi:hypothetical protein